jgi:hypothetical protein
MRLAFVFSPLFVFFGCHRKITYRSFRLAERRKSERKNAVVILLLLAVLLRIGEDHRAHDAIAFSNALGEPTPSLAALIFLLPVFLPTILPPSFLSSAVLENSM